MSKIVFLKNLQTLLTPLKRLIDRKAENVNWNENDPSASGYIANRPFYTNEEFEKFIDSTVSIDEDYGYAELTTLPNQLIPNETYLVTLNGATYECVARDWDGDCILIGNGEIYGDGNPSNNEPFVCDSYSDGSIFLNVLTAGDYTITISGKIEKIVKVPNKYLPKTIPVQGIGDGAEVFNEGSPDSASGNYSHAEGLATISSGYVSHAEGLATTASGNYQHVQGKYNIADGNNQYAHIVGNGNNSARSNAHTLDWNGVGWFAGGLKVGGTGQNDTAAVGVALKSDVAIVCSGTPIPSGADLNTYTTLGNYRSSSQAISATLLNTPCTTAGFKLEVFATATDNQIMQEIKCHTDSAEIYRRIAIYTSNTWTFKSWYKVMQSTSDALAIGDGGTGATTSEQARKNLGVPYYAKYDAGNLQTGAGDTSAWITYYGDNGTTYNQMDLGKDATSFSKPVNLTSGGTGASNQTGAWNNIVAPGGTMTGTITLHTTGLKTSHEAGYTTNQYGNLVHLRADAADTWGICSNSNVANFKVAYETGNTTIAGTAYIKKTVVNDAYPSLLFATTSRTGMEHAFIQMNATNSQLGFYSYATDQDANSTKYYEGYYLPTPDSGRTAKKTYPILTGKSPVTIAQGGTGLTKASDVQSFFMNSYTATGDIDISTKDVFTLPPGIYHHESETSTANHYPIAATRALVEVKGQYRTGTASAADGYPNGYWSIRVYYPYTGEEYWNHRTWSSWQGWRRVYNSAGIGTPLKISGASTPGIDFYDTDTGVNTGNIYFNNGDANRRFFFKQYGSDMDSASTRYAEAYRFPVPDTGRTSNATYDILTTKQVVYSSTQPAYAAGKIWLKPV